MGIEDRRASIIEATLPLLLAQGPDLSTREIARAAGIAEGTIFRAFDTKQDLIEATVLAALQPDLAIAQLEELPSGQTLPERVAAVLDVLRAEIQRKRSLFVHFTQTSAPAPPPHHHHGGLGPHDTKLRMSEAVADARRTPKMQGFVHGKVVELQEHQAGTLTTLPDLPTAIDAATTAAYIRQVMDAILPVPAPIAQQVAHILHLVHAL